MIRQSESTTFQTMITDRCDMEKEEFSFDCRATVQVLQRMMLYLERTVTRPLYIDPLIVALQVAFDGN